MRKVVATQMTVYPESLPEDWEYKLLSVGVGFLHALHDADVNEDGELKKEHIHILFQHPLNAKQKKYVSSVTTVNYFVNVNFPADAELYLTHESKNAIKENKHIYPKDIIKQSSNFVKQEWEDLKEDIPLQPPKLEPLDIMEIIEMNDITDFRSFMRYIALNYDDKTAQAYAKQCFNSNMQQCIREYCYQKKSAQTAHNAREQGSNTCKVKTPADMLDDLSGLSRGNWVDL